MEDGGRSRGGDPADRAWAREQIAVARSKIDLELYDQAIGTLQALVAREGGTGEAFDAYLLMASVHEARGEREDAIATYLDVRARYPDHPRTPEAMLRMADLVLKSRKRGKEAEALKVYADVAERYRATPWAPRALMAKGDLEDRLRLHRRDPELAAAVPAALLTYRDLAAAYPHSPEHEGALWKLSRLYQRIKRYDLAVKALAELGERYPSTEHDPWFEAGEIYEKRLKIPTSARIAYARVPSSSPRFDDAQERLGSR